MNMTTGTMLDGIASDLLRIGRELADTHALVNAATMVARGAAKATDADDWYSEAEHLTPLLDASDQLRAARLAILDAVREVQGTNPVIIHDHSYKDEPNIDDARHALLNHWEGDHAKDADSYEEAGGNATRMTWEELIDLHRENH